MLQGVFKFVQQFIHSTFIKGGSVNVVSKASTCLSLFGVCSFPSFLFVPDPSEVPHWHPDLQEKIEILENGFKSGDRTVIMLSLNLVVRLTILFSLKRCTQIFSLNLLLGLRCSLVLMPSPMWGLILKIISTHKHVSSVTALGNQVMISRALLPLRCETC